MTPREFTNSTAMHLEYEIFEQEQIKNFLFSMDPDKRDRLAEACLHTIRYLTPKSRKGLGLVKLCASLIEEGFAASSIVPPPARELRSSRVAATAISVALGVLCVAGLLWALGPSRASSFLVMKKVSQGRIRYSLTGSLQRVQVRESPIIGGSQAEDGGGISRSDQEARYAKANCQAWPGAYGV